MNLHKTVTNVGRYCLLLTQHFSFTYLKKKKFLPIIFVWTWYLRYLDRCNKIVLFVNTMQWEACKCFSFMHCLTSCTKIIFSVTVFLFLCSTGSMFWCLGVGCTMPDQQDNTLSQHKYRYLKRTTLDLSLITKNYLFSILWYEIHELPTKIMRNKPGEWNSKLSWKYFLK